MEIVLGTLIEWLQRSIRNRFVKWVLVALVFSVGLALIAMEWHNRLN